MLLRIARLARVLRIVRLLPDLRVLTIAIGRIDPRRPEPRGAHDARPVHLRDGRLDDLRRPCARPVRVDRRGHADAVRLADAREPARSDRARPRALGLDDHLLRELRADRRVSHLQHPHRRRHQLTRRGAGDRARERTRRPDRARRAGRADARGANSRPAAGARRSSRPTSNTRANAAPSRPSRPCRGRRRRRPCGRCATGSRGPGARSGARCTRGRARCAAPRAATRGR